MSLLSTIICTALATPKFVNDLVLPTRLVGECFDLVAAQTLTDFGLAQCDATTGQPIAMTAPYERVLTPAAGYSLNAAETATYMGPTIMAQRGRATKIRFINKLCSKQPHPLLAYIDPNIHIFHSMHCELGQVNCCPIVAHLHGGETIDAFDGYPDKAKFETDGAELYVYSNEQPAGNMWFHDHTLGFTRLNVYLGLIGVYLLRDDWETKQFLGIPDTGKDVLQGMKQFTNYKGNGVEMELVIQDKEFGSDINDSGGKATAQLVYGDEGVVGPEFFGSYMMVNGKVWPKVDITNRWYRLRILNGCDSRFLALQLQITCANTSWKEHGTVQQMYKIGVDQGFMPAVVAYPPKSWVKAGETTKGQQKNYMFMGPSSRADVIIDASGLATGCDLKLINRAAYPFHDKAPFGGDGTDIPDPNVDGQIMLFRLAYRNPKPLPLPSQFKSGSTYFNPRGADAYTPVPPIANYRHVILNEREGPVPILGAVVNGVPREELEWCDMDYQITEKIVLGDTEQWYIHNISPDAHPIHLHLVKFFVVDRCDQLGYPEGPFDYNNVNTNCEGGPRLGEEGPQDVVIASEGKITKIRATFERPGLYVWHCHIISHEDNEMMRPLCVTATSEPGREGVDCYDYWQGCKSHMGDFPDPPIPQSALSKQTQKPLTNCNLGNDGSSCTA